MTISVIGKIVHSSMMYRLSPIEATQTVGRTNSNGCSEWVECMFRV